MPRDGTSSSRLDKQSFILLLIELNLLWLVSAVLLLPLLLLLLRPVLVEFPDIDRQFKGQMDDMRKGTVNPYDLNPAYVN